MPISLARMTAHIFELLPKPLITNDQLRLLKYDNVLSASTKIIMTLSSTVRQDLRMR